MLNELLKFIGEKGDFSTAVIAKKFRVSESMVDDMKNRLIQMGYLEKDECNTEACEKCSCGCGKTRKLNLAVNWKVTEKGVKFSNK